MAFSETKLRTNLDAILFLDIERNGKYVIIGIDIKNTEPNSYINAITTAFYKDRLNDKILYVDKKTAEQQALLGRLNSPSYLAASGLNLNIPQHR